MHYEKYAGLNGQYIKQLMRKVITALVIFFNKPYHKIISLSATILSLFNRLWIHSLQMFPQSRKVYYHGRKAVVKTTAGSKDYFYVKTKTRFLIKVSDLLLSFCKGCLNL